MNILDKAIAFFSSEKALKREVARKKLEILDTGYSNHGASTTKSSMKGWISTGGGVKRYLFRGELSHLATIDVLASVSSQDGRRL